MTDNGSNHDFLTMVQIMIFRLTLQLAVLAAFFGYGVLSFPITLYLQNAHLCVLPLMRKKKALTLEMTFKITVQL